MKKLRVLVAVHESLVPPDSLEGYSDREIEEWRTEYDVVIMQGEAILGLEAAAAGLLSPGDKVLNLVSGVFGKWFEDFIHKYGGETIELAVPYNDAIDPEDVLHADRHAIHCRKRLAVTIALR